MTIVYDLVRLDALRLQKQYRYLIRPRPAIRQIASMRPLRTATISSCRCTVVSE